MEYFKTEIDIRIDWSEMDLFGHVNNVSYFKYVQAARVNYCESVGINTYNPNIKQSFAVAASNCEFKQPLYYPEEICIISTIEWIKNTSFKLVHFIYNSKKELVATASDIIVLFDYLSNLKMPISEQIKTKMLSR
ncbi:MAG: acyl-CoA thioesterase [Bacteroidota bacterium]|nr:acyl-CoA thioesterase [Bacteroidota bacterium]